MVRFDLAGVPIAQLMRSPSLITDDRLRREVEECIAQDKDYSPHMDRVRRGLGAEYEFILQQKLRARRVYVYVAAAFTTSLNRDVGYRMEFGERVIV